MIEIDGAGKRYGATVAVDGVSLRLPRGGITSIIGPNGSGKSTLLALISRLLPMSCGSVTVDGLDVSRTPGEALARRLAILRQDNTLAMRLTVRELVAFGRFPYSRGRLTAQDRVLVEAALDQLQLAPLADRFLDELSGGQRQRAFVAMVFCQDTECVLLDEPLNHLDLRHAVAMMRLLRRAADEVGKTIVLVLHDINFASCYSDRIVAMQEGRVAGVGSPAEMMVPEVLAPLYGMPVDVHEIGGRRIGMYYA